MTGVTDELRVGIANSAVPAAELAVVKISIIYTAKANVSLSWIVVFTIRTGLSANEVVFIIFKIRIKFRAVRDAKTGASLKIVSISAVRAEVRS